MRELAVHPTVLHLWTTNQFLASRLTKKLASDRFDLLVSTIQLGQIPKVLLNSNILLIDLATKAFEKLTQLDQLTKKNPHLVIIGLVTKPMMDYRFSYVDLLLPIESENWEDAKSRISFVDSLAKKGLERPLSQWSGILTDDVRYRRTFPDDIGKEVSETITLNFNDITYLYMISEGYSKGDIAKRLKRSVRTVESFRPRIAKKFEGKTFEQILIEASRIGWI